MATIPPATQAPPHRKLDWWVRFTVALAVLQALCWLIPQARPGLMGALIWEIGHGIVPGVALLIWPVALIWSIVRRPFWRRSRVLGFTGLTLLTASGALFQVYPSSHDFAPSQVRFRVPLEGPVLVGWGGGTPRVNYHVVAPDQRWAYDLLMARDGKTSRGQGKALSDFYIYDVPVLAPANGTVRLAFDRDTDRPIGEMEGYRNPAGNHIVIEVAPRQFVYLCHLKPGSIRVKPGDKVVEGQELARAGNSGHTSEPHLHIHLQDSARLGLSEGIPLFFHHYRTGGRYVERGIPTGGAEGDHFIGQVVENVAL